MADKKSVVFKYIPFLTLKFKFFFLNITYSYLNADISHWTYFLIPWIQPAKSLVILPDSIVSIQAFSKVLAQLITYEKQDHKLFELQCAYQQTKKVLLDKCLVVVQFTTVGHTPGPCKDTGNRIGGSLSSLLVLSVMSSDCTVSSLGLHGLAVGRDENRSHETQWPVALSNNVWLDIAVVVLARPHKSSLWLQHLSDHVINETVLIPDAQSVEILEFWIYYSLFKIV